jgi:hypothetical protein
MGTGTGTVKGRAKASKSSRAEPLALASRVPLSPHGTRLIVGDITARRSWASGWGLLPSRSLVGGHRVPAGRSVKAVDLP